MLGWSVNNMARRSIPQPHPAVGGNPYSNAVQKFCCCCATKTRSGTLDHLILQSSVSATNNSNRSVNPGMDRSDRRIASREKLLEMVNICGISKVQRPAVAQSRRQSISKRNRKVLTEKQTIQNKFYQPVAEGDINSSGHRCWIIVSALLASSDLLREAISPVEEL